MQNKRSNSKRYNNQYQYQYQHEDNHQYYSRENRSKYKSDYDGGFTHFRNNRNMIPKGDYSYSHSRIQTQFKRRKHSNNEYRRSDHRSHYRNDYRNNHRFYASSYNFSYGAQLNFLKRQSEANYRQGFKLESARINERILHIGKIAFGEISDRQRKTIILKTIMCINDYRKLGCTEDADRAVLALKSLLVKYSDIVKGLWSIPSNKNAKKYPEGCKILRDFFGNNKKNSLSNSNENSSRNKKESVLNDVNLQGDSKIKETKLNMNINARQWYDLNKTSKLTHKLSSNNMSMHKKYRSYHPSLKNDIQEENGKTNSNTSFGKN